MSIKTRGELKTENTADFPDNTTRLISPANLRGQMDDVVDSMFMAEDLNQPNGPAGTPPPGFAQTPGDAAFDFDTGAWSGTDASAEIQSVIDEHVYNLVGLDARLGNGRWLLGRGIQLGYGAPGVRTGRLRGSGAAYNGDGFAGSVLAANFSDEPVVNIQGARSSELTDISLIGANQAWIQDNNLGNPTVGVTLLNDKLISNWVDPALDARADSQYAPLAIIAIDGRSANSKADHYRDADYSFLGTGIAQYDKSFSSHVNIRRFHLRGGYVGVVIQPNSTSGPSQEGNGDFVTLADGIIADCAVGVHPSHTQSRCVSVTNVSFSKCHTVFSNNIFGRQSGRFGPLFNVAADHFINFFDFNSSSILGSIAMINCYGEAGYRLGNINASSSVEQEVSLIDCAFHFDNQNSAPTGRGIPATIVTGAASGTGQLLPFRVIGGSWASFYGVAFINLAFDGIVIDGLELQSDTLSIDAAAVPLARKCARNGFAGGLCFPSLGLGRRLTRINPKFVPYNLDTGALSTTMNVGPRFASNRTICTPLWTEWHYASADTNGDQGVPIPRKRIGGISAAGFNLVLTNITLTGTLPGAFTEAVRMTQGGMSGDVVLLDAYSTVAVIDTLVGTNFSATLINNFQGTTPINPINIASGACYLACMRYYSPALPVYGRFTSGSAVITEISQSPVGTEISPITATHIGVNDYIVVDDSLASFLTQANAKVTARDDAAHTITLNGNALADSTSRGLYGSNRIRIGTLARAL